MVNACSDPELLTRPMTLSLDDTALPAKAVTLAPGEGIRRNRLLRAIAAEDLDRLLPSLESGCPRPEPLGSLPPPVC